MTETCQLYLITPPLVPDHHAFSHELEKAIDGGPIAALQIRLKTSSKDELRAFSRLIAPVAQKAGIAVLMNDHVDLVRELGLDGVHIGQTDMPLKEARKALGPSAMIGVTCHNSRHLAMEASEGGADYVAFGAFYPTTTKDVIHMAELETLTIWQETMEIPCVAIGGITSDTAPDIVRAGADFIAVSSCVWNHPEGATEGVRYLLDSMAKAI
jgi:thiamine-phosphate pyrophosphorylase